VPEVLIDVGADVNACDLKGLSELYWEEVIFCTSRKCNNLLTLGCKGWGGTMTLLLL